MDNSKRDEIDLNSFIEFTDKINQIFVSEFGLTDRLSKISNLLERKLHLKNVRIIFDKNQILTDIQNIYEIKSDNETAGYLLFESESLIIQDSPLYVLLNDVLIKLGLMFKKAKCQKGKCINELKLYETLISKSPIGISIRDRFGTLLLYNPSWKRIWGLTDEEISEYQKPKEKLIFNTKDNYLSNHQENIKRIYEKGGEYQAKDIKLQIPKIGKAEWVSQYYYAILDKDNIPEKVVILTEDISDRKKIEKSLEESKYQLLEAQKIAKIGHYEINFVTQKWTVSDSFIDFAGLGRTHLFTPFDWERIIHPDHKNKVSQYFRQIINEQNPLYEEEYLMINQTTQMPFWIKTNGIIEYDDLGKPVRMFGTIQDITASKEASEKQKRLEEQLRKSQRMETIGTLAGGIAHDFNNILTPIFCFSEIILRKMDDKSSSYIYLKNINEAALRAKELVSQILTFSKRTDQEMQPVNIIDIIEETTGLLRSAIPKTINIYKFYNSENSLILADSSQIHQVLMNLCTNASHALEKNGGNLTITTEDVLLESKDVKYFSNLNEGHYLVLTVEDNGVGMDKATMDRIFEPFFTTKSDNKGTGLGLSVVHGIIESHNGEITVYSKMGIGTKFKIYLPLFGEELNIVESEKEELIGGKENIIVVDDEAIVAKTIEVILKEFGYNVSLFTSSKEAFDTFSENPNNFDLIISDQSMPIMTGSQLAKSIYKVRNDIPIILMSGYYSELNLSELKEYNVKLFLDKPIMTKELIKSVRMILNNK